MGVLEFFGTLIKNNITSSSIRSNFREKLAINHLFLDFNSIIHVSSQRIVMEVNVFLAMTLANIYNHRAVNNIVFTEKFERYQMLHIQKKITTNSDPKSVIMLFREHFTDKYMDKLIITLVINTVLQIVRTYCQNKIIRTLMFAIDGVPSKGKMVEQKQRRYLGAIIEEYKKKILATYREYLRDQPDYEYLATIGRIKWTRNKITPGTGFMHKLVKYLLSDKIQAKLKTNRSEMEIILSDMYEVGEGEKKIINYIIHYLADTVETVMIYSPDADMILLCMLLPVKKLYILRHNQQLSTPAGNIYNLIDIRMLKSNISYYINNHPDYAKEEFEIDRINYDIVCMSTLFGNDFVPKVETLNVKNGFQNIMDAYLKTLLLLKSKGLYLVKKNDGKFMLSFVFLKNIIRFLLPEENDFIKHNKLYVEYITIGQIKHVFDYMEINSENLVATFNGFRQEYDSLKNLIKNNGNFTYFETNDQFMNSLKRSVMIIMDDQCVNTSYLTNKEMIKLLTDYFRRNRDFPRLNINLNTWSHSANDFKHKKIIKEKKYNEYEIELYKFDHMLDKYYTKFNAEPLNLTRNKINDYYEDYFGVTLFDQNKNLTKGAQQIMHDYLEGVLWVFNYYFNDTSYINRWYYVHERAPLMTHFLMFLDSITAEYFSGVYKGLSRYQVDDLSTYFNPVEQLIYVSPMTPEIIKLLPPNYQKYIRSDNLDPFLTTYFIDTENIAKRMFNEKVSTDVDCHSIMFLNKCIIKSIKKFTAEDDKQFLRAIRKVKPDEVSIRRSKMTEPEY